jgi:ArsR family transcriptional regulator
MTGRCCCDLSDRLRPDLFRALADPNRLQMLADLAHARAPMSVSEIASERPQDLSVVSRHLALLRDAGVVEAERSGRSVNYRVRYEAVAELLRGLADAVERCSCGCCEEPAGAVGPIPVSTTARGGTA